MRAVRQSDVVYEAEHACKPAAYLQARKYGGRCMQCVSHMGAEYLLQTTAESKHGASETWQRMEGSELGVSCM
jgi:hypothetical protein